MQKLSISELPIHGKKILMRVDFNAPLKKGRITDESRVLASLPSIRYVLDQGGALILMSHLGRPEGKINQDLSLKPFAKLLEELLNVKVIMAPDCIGAEVEKLADELQPGQILLLENLRFHPGEEDPKNYPEFVKDLARLGEYYVNDAFGTAHRYHASTAAIAQYFPGKASAGFLLEKEIQYLWNALQNPIRPFQVIMGGAKISTKIGTIESLLKKAEVIMIGGAMAYTFFKAQGFPIGNSLYEEDQIPKARYLLEESHRRGVRLLLPIDSLIAEAIQPDAKCNIVENKLGIPNGWQGVDIGPKTVEQFTEELQKAKTVLWNGPLGIFEIEAFAEGTMAIANALAKLDAMTIVGGGDSLAAIKAAGVGNKISHLSTGGGASLEYIEFGTLPGIEALSDRGQQEKS